MLVREFLVEWKTLVLDDDWRQRPDCCPDELMKLRDAGPDYDEFLSASDAVGNHVVLLAICGVLSKRARTRITAHHGAGACLPPLWKSLVYARHAAQCPPPNEAVHAAG